MNRQPTIIQQRALIGLLVFLGLLRLLSLCLYPLADTTEARYAEIARLMVSSGDWITPHIEPGVPFWGKPPLSTWLSAASFRVFGVHELAARLPSFLLSFAIVWLIYSWSKQLKGKSCAIAAAVILCTSSVFFISSGAVMTDTALLMGTTLSMVAFYRALDSSEGSSRFWGYLFFVGLAISLLGKGPVGVVLTLLPTGGWVLLQRRWQQVWQRLPWITGLLLMLSLCLPWYLLAERKTPGFLDYFLLGEHWKRFVDSGWKGDLYGQAHARPRGMIWLYWLLSALPWSLVAIGSIVLPKCRRQASRNIKDNSGLSIYLILWSATPMLFFTLAGNILWTYVLPGIPAFAMLVALLWGQPQDSIDSAVTPNRSATFLRVAVGMTILFSVALLIMSTNLVPHRKCQKSLIENYQSIRAPGAQLAYLYSRPHSARFYSRGKALLLKDPLDAEVLLENGLRDYFVIRKNQLNRLPAQFAARIKSLGEYNGYELFIERPK